MRAADTQSARMLVEPLTRREGQMLALLAEGDSRPEIAVKLTLALTSVKFHIQHLYGKLGVNSKRQALTRAKELGLLAAGPGFQAALPPRKHNLPLQVTRFFGREAEIVQLRDLLDDYRLVTLTGSGGVGKTRLSLRVAEESLTEFRDGVCFVDLAPLADPALVPRQTAFSLGLREEPGRTSLETLLAYLSQRQALLVLDNCEHLLEACARLADSLLRAGPALKILTTSREPLGAGGEAVFRVPSLPFPDPTRAPSMERLADFPSVRLFVDRARLVMPDYQVAGHNSAPIARICQRLDGIPLALELAAARVKLLTAEQVAARLDDTLGLLTGGGRTALARHQTLQATIDWSYTLLTEPERVLLQRLSVFAGGCTLAAAEAVCAREDLPADRILDALTALVDKSLVIADRQPGLDTRYHLLEMVRQYAAARLDEAGERSWLQTRHAHYWLDLTESKVYTRNTSQELPWTRALASELNNVRLALAWSFGELADDDAGPRQVEAMAWLWPSFQEDLQWTQRAIAWCESRSSEPAELYALLLTRAAHLVSNYDVGKTLAWSQKAVEVGRRLGPSGYKTLVQVLGDLGITYQEILGDYELARAPYAEAERIFQAIPPAEYTPEQHLSWRAGFALAKARLADQEGKHADAKRHAAQSIRLFRQSGSPNIVDPLISLGAACLNLGEFEAARSPFLEGLQRVEGVDTYWGQNRAVLALRWLAYLDYRQGRLDEALAVCRQALEEAAEAHDYNIMASGLGIAALVAAEQSHTVRAATLAGAAQALYARQRRKPWERFSLDTQLPGWQAGPDRAALAAAFEDGQAMPAEVALAYALSDAAADA